MTKQQIIDKYGIEVYNKRLAHSKEYSKKHKRIRSEEYRNYMKNYCKERYANDCEYRNHIKNRTLPYFKYVKDKRIDLVENYDLAKVDNFKGWVIHHKLGIREDYKNSHKELKLMNLYYDRPPEELIWMRNSEHTKLHRQGDINV